MQEEAEEADDDDDDDDDDEEVSRGVRNEDCGKRIHGEKHRKSFVQVTTPSISSTPLQP